MVAKRVAGGERLAVVGRVGHGDAGSDRVTGAKQGAEVRPVGDPERRDDQVVPAAVPAIASTATQILSAELRGAQRAKATGLS